MRVCIIDPSLFTLPYDQHLCAGLRAGGVDVTLCGRALRPEETLLPHAYPLATRCYPLTERGRNSGAGKIRAWFKAAEHLWTSARLAAWLRPRFDVLHFQWSPLPLVDRWHWRRLARDRTVIFTVHDTTPFLGRPTSRGQQLGWRGLLDAADGLIVHTDASRRDLVELGVSAERISVIPHGPLYPAGTAPDVAANRAAAAGPRTLLVFGEIKPYKGIDVLLRALARVPADVAAGWRLVIAGRPRCDVGPLRALAAQARVPVEWRLGFVPEAGIAPLFAGAEVAVFPYRRVDASGALMLTVPFGVPIVATRVGIFQELLEHDVTGVLATPGDERSLARALARVMRDEPLRAQLRRNLRDRATRLWSWTAIAGRHVETYHRHLRGRGFAAAEANPGTTTPMTNHEAKAALSANS